GPLVPSHGMDDGAGREEVGELQGEGARPRAESGPDLAGMGVGPVDPFPQQHHVVPMFHASLPLSGALRGASGSSIRRLEGRLGLGFRGVSFGTSMAPGSLAVVDWRRRTAALYAQIRAEPDPRKAHALWCTT